MELSSGVSPAGCNHAVLLRKSSEANFSVVLRSLPTPFLCFVFYRQSCFVVHDLPLVVSVSMMGFCELQGDRFVK